MDLKEVAQNFKKSAEHKHLDSWMLLVIGVIGLVITVATLWLALSDLRSQRAVSRVTSQQQAVIDQLARPVQALKRVMNEEQVQSLAAGAIETPAMAEELRSHLNRRINQISDVRVFGSNLTGVDPDELGMSGYAVLDMLMNLQENKHPRLQLHSSLVPPRMVDAVRVMSGDDLVGYMVVMLEPDYLLSHFNPDFSLLGYISLSQYNGRQASNILAELGDRFLAGEVPERQSVPGTLFRIEFPHRQYTHTLSFSILVNLLLAGVLLLVGATLLYRHNRRLAKAEPVASKPTASEPLVDSVDELPATPEFTTAPRTEDEPPREAPEITDKETEPPPMHLRYDVAARRKTKEPELPPVELTAAIFRAYDIRGVIGKTLDAGVARLIGQAVGTVVLNKDAGPVVVARDGRLSGPALQAALIEGITSTGCDVLDIGAMPTGVLYYATFELAAGSGVMITGSHNPPDYNGFKIMVAGDVIHSKELSNFYHRIVEGAVHVGSGLVHHVDVVEQYIERIAQDIQLEKPLKVVIDCGNGIGGVCAADVLRAIGAEVLPLYDEVDGTFPNHHPDPSEPENLKDLIESVKLIKADLGFALDGDADRLGVVTQSGDIIYADRLMMLLATAVLDRKPGATIIYDVKCTGHLAEVIREAGGNPVMYKTGHSLIKSKMKEIDSPFAGEMSGHFFFGERWYGVDDGIYAAARLLEILAGAVAAPEAILNALPTSFSTPELKVHMEEGENFIFVEAFRKVAHFEGASINTIDGLRADWPDGWGLVRGSNTTPVLVVRFDADTEVALERIKSEFKSQMLEVNPDLQLPF